MPNYLNASPLSGAHTKQPGHAGMPGLTNAQAHIITLINATSARRAAPPVSGCALSAARRPSHSQPRAPPVVCHVSGVCDGHRQPIGSQTQVRLASDWLW